MRARCSADPDPALQSAAVPILCRVEQARSPRPRRPSPRRRRRRLVGRSILFVLALLGVAGIAVAAGIVWWSGATLAGDRAALARIEVQPLGGSLVSAKAFGPGGARIPLVVRGSRLTPKALLRPGERVTVEVVVRRPGWLGWALGRSRTERLTLHTPVSQLASRWLSVAPRAPVRLRFTGPVGKVVYGTVHPTRTVAAGGRRVVTLGRQLPVGTFEVASAARSWERVGAPERVTWFPATPLPVVLVSPAPNRQISPLARIRLTFSQPVADVVGASRPHFSSKVSGTWRMADSHTLLFTPSGLGFPLATDLHLELPRTLTLSDGDTTGARARTVDWSTAPGSLLRLQQLLADAGYLPVDWRPSAAPVAQEPLAEVDAAIAPPSGSFVWRYPNTPSELVAQWTPGQPNQITRGAVMMFEHDHDLTVDAFAGEQVWHALIADAIAGKRRTDGYSYVYVHRDVPQLLTLWHNGRTVLTSPGNTGVPAAPTQLGTFPVFEHIPVGTMSGTNPDGSHYNDPGIRWISYFHGGDALHSFNRASFGTPQSLGCVELPLASAAEVWPYTPIGTLVTIES
jgi:hypothetical protein